MICFNTKLLAKSTLVQVRGHRRSIQVSYNWQCGCRTTITLLSFLCQKSAANGLTTKYKTRILVLNVISHTKCYSYPNMVNCHAKFSFNVVHGFLSLQWQAFGHISSNINISLLFCVYYHNPNSLPSLMT